MPGRRGGVPWALVWTSQDHTGHRSPGTQRELSLRGSSASLQRSCCSRRGIWAAWWPHILWIPPPRLLSPPNRTFLSREVRELVPPGLSRASKMSSYGKRWTICTISLLLIVRKRKEMARTEGRGNTTHAVIQDITKSEDINEMWIQMVEWGLNTVCVFLWVCLVSWIKDKGCCWDVCAALCFSQCEFTFPRTAVVAVVLEKSLKTCQQIHVLCPLILSRTQRRYLYSPFCCPSFFLCPITLVSYKRVSWKAEVKAQKAGNACLLCFSPLSSYSRFTYWIGNYRAIKDATLFALPWRSFL